MKRPYAAIHFNLRAAAAALAAAALIFCAAKTAVPAAAPTAAEAEVKTVYLTFDDGPSSATAAVLEALAEQQVEATFFVIGGADPQYLPLISEEAAAGHAVGVHTQSHIYGKIYASEEAFWGEAAECAGVIESLTGRAPTLLRFPGGSGNTVAPGWLMRQLTASCEDHGYSYHDWNVDPGDNLGYTLDAGTLAERVVSGCEGKSTAVVLMHDSAANTTAAEALRIIIPRLRELGFSFATLESIEEPAHQRLPG